MLEENIQSDDCVLVMGDSTTAMGWLYKIRIQGKGMDVDDFIARSKVARKQAAIVIENKFCLYSQWFPGTENIIADSL